MFDTLLTTETSLRFIGKLIYYFICSLFWYYNCYWWVRNFEDTTSGTIKY